LTEITQTEQERRDAELRRAWREERGMAQLIRTRARAIRDDPPPPDRQRSRDALTSARRQAWGEWHLDQAERLRANLATLADGQPEAPAPTAAPAGPAPVTVVG
jgi:hypothetical protein